MDDSDLFYNTNWTFQSVIETARNEGLNIRKAYDTEISIIARLGTDVPRRDSRTNREREQSSSQEYFKAVFDGYKRALADPDRVLLVGEFTSYPAPGLVAGLPIETPAVVILARFMSPPYGVENVDPCFRYRYWASNPGDSSIYKGHCLVRASEPLFVVEEFFFNPLYSQHLKKRLETTKNPSEAFQRNESPFSNAIGKIVQGLCMIAMNTRTYFLRAKLIFVSRGIECECFRIVRYKWYKDFPVAVEEFSKADDTDPFAIFHTQQQSRHSESNQQNETRALGTNLDRNTSAPGHIPPINVIAQVPLLSTNLVSKGQKEVAKKILKRSSDLISEHDQSNTAHGSVSSVETTNMQFNTSTISSGERNILRIHTNGNVGWKNTDERPAAAKRAKTEEIESVSPTTQVAPIHKKVPLAPIADSSTLPKKPAASVEYTATASSSRPSIFNSSVSFTPKPTGLPLGIDAQTSKNTHIPAQPATQNVVKSALVVQEKKSPAFMGSGLKTGTPPPTAPRASRSASAGLPQPHRRPQPTLLGTNVPTRRRKREPHEICFRTRESMAASSRGLAPRGRGSSSTPPQEQQRGPLDSHVHGTSRVPRTVNNRSTVSQHRPQDAGNATISTRAFMERHFRAEELPVGVPRNNGRRGRGNH
ncbi:hypothetical protein DFH27DRAFT_326638 [Peziza echinospora]|nr:hypothetical protein DFH27DRAFT_326638 [Peziza echinospora]